MEKNRYHNIYDTINPVEEHLWKMKKNIFFDRVCLFYTGPLSHQNNESVLQITTLFGLYI